MIRPYAENTIRSARYIPNSMYNERRFSCFPAKHTKFLREREQYTINSTRYTPSSIRRFPFFPTGNTKFLREKGGKKLFESTGIRKRAVPPAPTQYDSRETSRQIEIDFDACRLLENRETGTANAKVIDTFLLPHTYARTRRAGKRRRQLS